MTATKLKAKPKTKGVPVKGKPASSKKPELKVVDVVPKPQIIDQKLIDAFRVEFEAVSGRQVQTQQVEAPVYSTGCLSLDLAMRRRDPVYGNGGIPERNMIELYGPTGVGKTITLFSMIAEVQKRGKLVVVVFSEEPSMEFAEMMGVDIDRLIILDAWSGRGAYVKDKKTKRKVWNPKVLKDPKANLAETQFNRAIRMSKHPDVGMIAIDSLKGMVGSGQVFKKSKTGAVTERGMEEDDMAVRAKFTGKFIDRLRNRADAIVVLVNHSSTPILSSSNYGSLPDRRDATCAGAYKEFESVYRIYVRSSEIKSAKIKEHPLFGYKGAPGLVMKYTLKKARWGGTNRKVESHFFYSRRKPTFVPPHWDKVGDVLKLAVYLGLLRKKGNYYSDLKNANGEAEARRYLEGRPELVAVLERKILERGEDVFEYIEGEDVSFAKTLEMPMEVDDDDDFDDEDDDDDED